MALFKTHSAAVYGIDAHLIDVEVDMYRVRHGARLHHGRHARYRRPGEPGAHQVRADEFRLRLSQNKGITINLAPANVRKEGAGFDLPDGARHSRRDGRAPGARPAHLSSASCRSTARSGRCAARCRWRSARASRASPI